MLSNELQQAKERLQGDATCVLLKGADVIIATQKGISPLLDLLTAKRALQGYVAADKIIGKAAAMLFYLAGIREVYGAVMSEAAFVYCQQRGIQAHYGTLVPCIINRKGDGSCPMEQTVAALSDEQEAFRALLDKRAQLLRAAH